MAYQVLPDLATVYLSDLIFYHISTDQLCYVYTGFLAFL